MKKLKTLLLFLLISVGLYSQTSCIQSQPFCTGTPISFVASTNTSAPSGPAYGCLFTQPNPSWYHLQIQNPGSINITLQGSNDVDFILWGPFTSATAPCLSGLNSGSIVDCSYSSSATEFINIPANSQAGQIYILLVTNYANTTQTLNLNQTSGSGSTNCSIVCNVSSANSGPVCPNGLINLNSTNVNNGIYSWSGPFGFTSNVQNPTNILVPATPGTYPYTVSVNNGSTTCTSTTNVIVKNPTLNPIPDQILCQGSSTTLNAIGSNLTNISWSNSIINNTSFIPVSTNTYIITANSVGCPVTDTVLITVNPLPIVNAGLDTLICNGDSITLNGSGTWNNGVINNVPFYPSSTLTYTLTNTVQGCSSSDDVVISVSQLPIVSFIIDNTIGCIPVDVHLTNTSSDTSNVFWSFGNGLSSNLVSPNVTYNSPGCFDITLSSINSDGCANSLTMNDAVCVFENPVAEFSPIPTSLTLHNTSTDMINLSTGGNSYYWNFGDGSVSNEFEPSHVYPTVSGSYLITLIVEANGCRDTAHVHIEIEDEVIFYVPNAFTPDGDDNNNIWQPIFTSGFDPYKYELLIFNRWGEIIFESHNSSIGWDGYYNGNVCKDGVYIWRISYRSDRNAESKVINGHVTLIK